MLDVWTLGLFQSIAGAASSIWPLFVSFVLLHNCWLSLQASQRSHKGLQSKICAEETFLAVQHGRLKALKTQIVAAKTRLERLQAASLLDEAACSQLRSWSCPGAVALAVARVEERELKRKMEALAACIAWSQEGPWRETHDPVTKADGEHESDQGSSPGEGDSHLGLVVPGGGVPPRRTLVAADLSAAGAVAGRLAVAVPVFEGPIIEMEEVLQECGGPLGTEAITSAFEGINEVFQGAVGSIFGRQSL
eukprot:TRINITY_DN84411_c0_g1_i1.p1 TRINITY_DN84411_c0_g1~~TRINITY_DN84411_c0_g1_i1.p1  ORF type:complete len:250 (+),score=52.85 TRINITY_DN84411_c0_g1_i1:62-811(+)